ncbi:MAG: biotin synthase BioB [Sinobacteraceae bacterium]|nr:biotin synthase BioB [Nevskiaceae bacterium]MCP5340353.1 biotin synthase BioB [Nevskiaceae bacterium]MCP5466797.1 biotin synthase BioB [Nevskiaceae bacterium]MCP5470598.1 biotin synthase BioB [Nevskiaceae bacterium]
MNATRTPVADIPLAAAQGSAAPAASRTATAASTAACASTPALTRLGEVRHDWTTAEVEALFALPFSDLLFQAQQVHRLHHAPNTVQMSTLLSIKTGACPEDCAYCPQSVRWSTGLEREQLLAVTEVRERAAAAKAAGATRFCMGAAWRSPKPRDLELVAAMIREVRALGMESCATLGMLTPPQAQQLKDAGLDYYNHNIDTSPEFYDKIITTRDFQDRLDTLEAVRDAGLKTCCGGIVGMGETVRDRARMLQTLANLPQHPESVPINQLVAVPGTPLADAAKVDPFDFVRTIAVARLTMPASTVRLSAGREQMSDELQALAFLAGANSIFYGEKLLTTGNPDVERDRALLQRLGINGQDVVLEHDDTADEACGHDHGHGHNGHASAGHGHDAGAARA